MKKKILKALIEKSYTGTVLDAKTVEQIANQLKRSDLKQYLDALSLTEKKRTVIFESALDLSPKEKEQLIRLFPDKTTEFHTNKELLAGLKIINNDVIYNFNLKNEFENLQNYIAEQI